MRLPKHLIAIAVVVAVLCGGVMIILRTPSDGMDAYPHAFISEPGYDPAHCRTHRPAAPCPGRHGPGMEMR